MRPAHHLSRPLVALALLTACATPAPAPESAESIPSPVAEWPSPDTHCASPDILLDAYFETGNLGQCTVEDDGSFTLSLIPEDAPPINPSPWYAFRASGAPGAEVRVRLEATRGHIRYWPKTSADGRSWMPLPAEQTDSDGDKSPWMTFRFTLDGAYRWVAGQEIMDTWDYQHRVRSLDEVDGVTARLLGQSVEGRPVYIAETADRPEFLLFVGRQHPPEVTGAIAMRTFMDTVFADTTLAQRFRDRFKLGVVPLMNPDGVARGHWRHNVGDVDLIYTGNPDLGPNVFDDVIALQEAFNVNMVAIVDGRPETLRLHDLLHLRQLVKLHWLHTTAALMPHKVDYAGRW